MGTHDYGTALAVAIYQKAILQGLRRDLLPSFGLECNLKKETIQ